MRTFLHIAAGLFITMMLFPVGMIRAQDLLKVAPDKTKLLIENDTVRVYEVFYKPGEKLPMHSHPWRVVYFLTSSKTKSSTPDGESTERESKAGNARWSEPLIHAVENIGTTDARNLIVELKEPAKMEMKKEEMMKEEEEEKKKD